MIEIFAHTKTKVFFSLNYFSALISHQLDQRQKLEQRLEQGKSELQTLKRNAHDLKVLLEVRAKFIQTGVVDVSLCKKVYTG